MCDVIVANRLCDQLEDVPNKVVHKRFIWEGLR